MRHLGLAAVVAVGVASCAPVKAYPVVAGVPGSHLDREVQGSTPLTRESRERLKSLVTQAFIDKPIKEAVAALELLGMVCGAGPHCVYAIDYPPGERELSHPDVFGRPGAVYSMSVWLGGPMPPRLIEEFGPPPTLTAR